MRLVKSPVYFFSCRLAHRLTGDVRQVIVPSYGLSSLHMMKIIFNHFAAKALSAWG